MISLLLALHVAHATPRLTSVVSPAVPLLREVTELIERARLAQPRWTDEMRDISLEWGMYLFAVSVALRMGEGDAALEGREVMAQTLAELNLRLQAVGSPAAARAIASVAIEEVARTMRTKLGDLNPEEIQLLDGQLRGLYTRLDTSAKRAVLAREAQSAEWARYRRNWHIRIWGTTLLSVTAVAGCAAALVAPGEGAVLHLVEQVAAGATVVGAAAFAIAFRKLGRIPPSSATDQDINFIGEPLSNALDSFSPPGRPLPATDSIGAAKPSAVSQAG